MDNMAKLQKQFEKDMQKAQKEFGENLSTVISNADVLLKR